MLEQPEESNAFIKIIGWITTNTIASFLIGVSVFFSLLPSISNSNIIRSIVNIWGGISFLGGGIVIAICQWIFLRRLQPKITGGGWVWMISGVVSSIGVSFITAFSVFALGDYPIHKDYVFFTILVISEQVILLSMVQGLILYANKYKKVLQWILLNVFGYSSAVVVSYNLTYKWTNDIGAISVLPMLALIMIFIITISGWGFIQILESHGNIVIDNSTTKKIVSKSRNLYFYQADLENKNLSGQILDGADFRKANLRMAILENASCEPIKVKKYGEGCLFVLLDVLLGGHSRLGTDFRFSKEEMKSTDFTEADLTGANLKQAKLHWAHFRNAILRQADLSNAQLVDADLSDADLTNANLSYSDMSNTLLCKTNLENADLTNANLAGANLDKANFKNAILKGADLRKVKYFDRADLTGADLSNALMPYQEDYHLPLPN